MWAHNLSSANIPHAAVGGSPTLVKTCFATDKSVSIYDALPKLTDVEQLLTFDSEKEFSPNTLNSDPKRMTTRQEKPTTLVGIHADSPTQRSPEVERQISETSTRSSIQIGNSPCLTPEDLSEVDLTATEVLIGELLYAAD